MVLWNNSLNYKLQSFINVYLRRIEEKKEQQYLKFKIKKMKKELC